MVTAQEMVEALRTRSAQQRVKAEARAQHLRSHFSQAKELLLRKFGVHRALLFGSLSTGTFSEDSDVDIAVEGLPSRLYFHALADLMALFGGPVDLVRTEDAPPSLGARIEEDGQVL